MLIDAWQRRTVVRVEGHDSSVDLAYIELVPQG